MSRKFRPTSLGSQSGIYSVRGSELARTGKTSSNQIRCVVELLDDSEFFIDIDVSLHDSLFSSSKLRKIFRLSNLQTGKLDCNIPKAHILCVQSATLTNVNVVFTC